MTDPHVPRQAATLPYRRMQGRTRLCLITASRSGKWGIPKGNIEPGETPDETALKESLEEAGLRGRLHDDPLGTYTYTKAGRTLRVAVFLMEVVQVEESWLEMGIRGRLWVDPDEALVLLAHHPVAPLLPGALDRIGMA